MTGGAKSLSLKGVAKRFGAIDAVLPLDLEVQAGEFLTLLGPSGCGKTTLLRLIAGLEGVSAGSVQIGAVDVTEASPNRRDTAIMFQDYALFPHMSVRENIAYGLKMRGVASAERLARAQAWLERVGLAEYGARRPHALSGGQRQRVALARALIIEPGALLLDEPLGALDANLRRQLRDELKRIHREVGTTFICVTHDQEEAMTLSDRIAVMRAGRIEQLAAPDELYDRPANLFVATFFGRCAVWPGEVTNADAGLCRAAGVAQPVPYHGARDFAAGAAVSLIARPEAFHRVAPDDPQALAVGAISEAHFSGAGYAVTVAIDGGPELYLELPRGDGPAPAAGDRIALALTAASLPAIAREDWP